MQQINLNIDGMGCGVCVRKVEDALKTVPGIRVEKVAVGSATCVIDPATTAAQQLIEAVAAAGYSATQNQ